jgi:hypothetical protein
VASKQRVSRSNPAGRAGRSSRFSRVYVHVWTRPAAAAVAGQDQGGCRRRFRGNASRNCVWRHPRVGWPRLTCGRDPNKTPSAQVKAKREDLADQRKRLTARRGNATTGLTQQHPPSPAGRSMHILSDPEPCSGPSEKQLQFDAATQSVCAADNNTDGLGCRPPTGRWQASRLMPPSVCASGRVPWSPFSSLIEIRPEAMQLSR